MSAAILEKADVASVESWLASPEAETAAEMSLLNDTLTARFVMGASW